MDGAGDQLLAGSALAANQHGDVRVRDAVDQSAHLGDAGVAAQQEAMRGLQLDLRSKRCELGAQLPLAQRVGQRLAERLLVERLGDEIGGAEPHRLDHGGRVTPAGDDDDGDVAVELLDRAQAWRDRRGPA